MATIHQATLTPTKLELLEAWLPGRHWYPSDTVAGLRRIAACRFDDPAGEVGIEIFIVRAGDGPLVQVPLTYRGAPMEDAEHWLIGTMEPAKWFYSKREQEPTTEVAIRRGISEDGIPRIAKRSARSLRDGAWLLELFVHLVDVS